MIKQILFLAAFSLFVFSIAEASHLPNPVGYVNDFAGILTDPDSIERELALYEENTTIEIAVVTISELPSDQTTATYVVEMFEEWGIGKKGEDNGILVLIVKDGQPGARMRIELGYGIQGYVTGAEAGRILDNALPYYEEGNYQTAVEIILGELSDELVDYVAGEYVPSSFDESLIDLVIMFAPFIFFLSMAVIAAFASRNKCPSCGSTNVSCSGDTCTCKKCGRKFKKRSRYYVAPVVFGGSGGGSSGGFGGFGGGGSGGGGAGR